MRSKNYNNFQGLERVREQRKRKQCILPETLGADAAYRITESDACAGSSGRCFHAGRNGSELYVCRFAGDTDPVYPEHVSVSCYGKSWNSGSAVLGKR